MTAKQAARVCHVLESSIGELHRWGLIDCNTLPLMAADAITGQSMADLLKGRYSDRESAEAYAEETGWTLRGLLEESGAFEIEDHDPLVPLDFLIGEYKGFDSGAVYVGAGQAVGVGDRVGYVDAVKLRKKSIVMRFK